MLTRAAVAKRLGKSIATVRRLEGRVLFPIVDHRGVRRFHESQVEHVRLLMREGIAIPAARGAWLNERAKGSVAVPGGGQQLGARTACSAPFHARIRTSELDRGKTLRDDL